MDLITYALAKKVGSMGGAAGEAGVITKLENSVQEVQKEIDIITTEFLPLAKGAVIAIKVGNKIINPTENVLTLPLASGEVVGLVKSTPIDSENSINKISVLYDGTMEVNSLSTDKLVQGEEVLILDCSISF